MNEKEKMYFRDGTKIEIESGSSLSDIKVVSETKYDMMSTWNMFTEDNLKEIQIQNTDGITIGQYENLVLDSETSAIQKNGIILTSFHLRTKTEIELLREEVEALKEGQDVQDGAISDLGEAVSDLSGGIA